MKLGINFRNLSGNGKLINYIDNRLSFAFARTRHQIEEMSITVSDLNERKDGLDKQCRLVLKPRGLNRFVVSEKQGSIQHAIDRCLARASECLNRKLKRRQMLLRKGDPRDPLANAG